ncbi:rRNA maturation RNase YbeY [Schlesneria paludicola]|uniref:rRNA maturation RNase YbeY n=1 Tax=Schlesneria paludicola TaxID=360056 RepID=UPI00029A7C4A|nr:rRNA maturation RNase YbeY [Schlesneria paludicola]
MPDYLIEIADQQSSLIVERAFLELAVARVLAEEGVASAKISLALVDDAEIHRVNRQFLGHDYPTDVISFRLDEQTESHDSAASALLPTEMDAIENAPPFEGELIVSTETAVREATAQGWSPTAELLLYVVHGLLHLCGYDDLTDDARPVMRTRERELLALWGFRPTGLES